MANVKEAKLNNIYSDCYTENDVVNELVYLTAKSRGKHTTENNIRKAYRERKIGTLLKRLDPIAFQCA